MKIVYGKVPSKEQSIEINNLSNQCGITFDTARLLYFRGIDTVDKITRFLNPTLKNLHNPMLFKDMKGVINKIQKAKENEQIVLVFGDYDADGVCATTILYNCLKEYGIKVFCAIPEREDGYGLNVEKILQMKKDLGVSLVITVDCGISDKDKILSLKEQSIDVIVTDHHEPPEELPDCLIINPKVTDSGYPFDGLCGAGVAYKVGFALISKNANKYLDFVALATVADSMNLIDENRDLVYQGLKLFESSKIRECFKQLLGDSDKTITASSLAYTLAPRINAGGRMGDALSALKLFISDNSEEIYNLAVLLNKYNVQRQTECDQVYRQTKNVIITQKLYNDNVICVKGEDWSAGVIGIVAAKLVEDYNRPVIVFAHHEGFYKGSARSVQGVNILNLIASAKHLLLGFGGHSQAAGVSVEYDKFEDFSEYISNKMQQIYDCEKPEPIIRVEWETDKPISVQFAKELDALEPFGTGNQKPCFVTTVKNAKPNPIKLGSPHYNLQSNALPLLYFNAVKDLLPLSIDVEKKIVYEINYSIYRGREQIKGFVKKVLPIYTDFNEANEFLYKNQLNSLMLPSGKAEMISYEKDIVKQGFGTLYVISDAKNLNKYHVPRGIEIYPMSIEGRSGRNCIVLSPVSVPDEYSTVVYLDKPLQIINTCVASYFVDIDGCSWINDVRTDREYFASVYNLLVSLECKQFNDSVYAHQNYAKDFDWKSFIFATEVFLELGLFDINNGLLTRNIQVKNALTNSLQYSKICSIKEKLC